MGGGGGCRSVIQSRVTAYNINTTKHRRDAVFGHGLKIMVTMSQWCLLAANTDELVCVYGVQLSFGGVVYVTFRALS